MDTITTTELPAAREAALRSAIKRIENAHAVLLTTHINADGDGAGCEIAIAAWLARAGKRVWIANPTPFPASFMHLVENRDWLADPGTAAATEAVQTADLVIVVDTGEPKRIGRLLNAARRKPLVVIDHHLSSDDSFRGTLVIDARACATGELVHDLLIVAGLPRPWPPPVREGVYTAIVSDTGSFRFSNTTPRAHLLAADLIEQGVDPEVEFRRIYATVPLRRIELLRNALDTLEADPEMPLTWITITNELMTRLGATSDDLDGIIDHARVVDGTEVAALFRETSDGQTKVSLRSSGDVDVNALARSFGGGGHKKASGALIAEPLETARSSVLEATRIALRDAGLSARVTRIDS